MTSAGEFTDAPEEFRGDVPGEGTHPQPHGPDLAGTARAVVGASHPGPTLTVTALTALLASGSRLTARRAGQVVAAVLLGQLSIGWGNDLADADRDRAVGRSDKPVASGAADPRLVVGLVAGALGGCAALSGRPGRRAALTHMGLVVISGHAYNLGLKGTRWSWLPYAAAFGALPSVVTLARPRPAPAPPRVTGLAAALGVGAHLLNAIRDLDDDARTGVRGLPHRLGERRSRLLAASLLTGASAVLAATGRGLSARGRGALLALNTVLAGVAVTGAGRAPFRAASAMALLDAVALVAEGHAIPAPVPARTATAKRTVAGTGSG